jgi:hypothetical protein
VHLLGLAMLGGAILVLDLRMLGVGLSNQSVASLARTTRPWMITAIVVLLATGIPLFLSEAVKCYYNTSFWVKMIGLVIGLTFTFTIRNRIALRESASPALYRTVAAFSLTTWLVVAAAGRWIGFS